MFSLDWTLDLNTAITLITLILLYFHAIQVVIVVIVIIIHFLTISVHPSSIFLFLLCLQNTFNDIWIKYNISLFILLCNIVQGLMINGDCGML